MDELEQLYGLFDSNNLTGGATIEDFRNADDSQRQQLYDLLKSNKIDGGVDYDTFNSAWGKKKSSDGISENQSLVSKETTESGLSDSSQDETGQLVKDIDAGKFDDRIEQLQAENDAVAPKTETFLKEDYSVNERRGINDDLGNNAPENVEVEGFENERMNQLNNRLFNEGILTVDEIKEVDTEIDRKKNKDFTWFEKFQLKTGLKNESEFDFANYEKEREDAVEAKIKQKQSDFFNNLDNDEREIFNNWNKKRGEKLSAESNVADAFNEKINEEIFKPASKKIEQLDNIIKQIESKPKDEITEQDINAYNNVVADRNKTVEDLQPYYKQYEANRKTLNNNIDDLMTFDREVDLSKRDYSFYANRIEPIGEGFKNILGGAVDLAESNILQLSENVALHIAGQMSDEIEQDTKEFFKKQKDKSAEWAAQGAKNRQIQSENKRIPRSIDNVNGIGDFAEYTGTAFVEQAPIYATLIATGGTGLAFVAASSGGNEFGELMLQNQDPKNFNKVSYGEAVMTGNAFAGAEYAFEKFTLGWLNKNKRLIASATKESKNQLTKSTFKESFKKVIDNSYKTLKTANKEGLTEVFTEIAQKGAENIIANKNNDIFDIDKETYIKSFITAGGMNATSSSISWAVGAYSTSENRKNVSKNTQDILKYQKILETENLEPAVREQYQENIDKLSKANQTIIDSSAEMVYNLSDDDFKKVTSINNKLRALKVTAEKNKGNEDLQNSLNEEYSKLDNQKTEIISNSSKARIDLLDQASRELQEEKIAEAKKSGQENYKIELSEKEINERANEIQKRADAKTQETTQEAKKQEVETTTLETQVESEKGVGITKKELQEDIKTLESILSNDNVSIENGNGSSLNDRVKVEKELEKLKLQLSEIETTNEAQAQGDTKPNADVQPNIERNIQQGKDNPIQKAVEPRASEGEVEIEQKILNDTQKKQNALVDAKNEYNRLSPSKQKSSEGSALIQKINNLASDFGFKVSQKGNRIKVLRENGKGVGKISFKEQLPEASKSDIHNAKVMIDGGFAIVGKDGRTELELDSHDIKKGVSDIRAGKYNTVPAKRLIEELKRVKQEGGVGYSQTSGKSKIRTFIPLTDTEVDNFVPSEEESKIISEQQSQLVQEFEDYLNTIDENGNEKTDLQRKDDGTDTRTKSKENVSNEKETKPKTKSERVKIANAKVDDIANAIKGIDEIFGVKIKVDNIDGLTKNGIDIVDVIAKIAKKAIEAGIEIDVAIQKTIEHLKKSLDFEVDVNDVKAKLDTKKATTPPKTTKSNNSFESKITDMPNSGVFGKYMSGETIEREHDAPRNEQDIEVMVLTEAGNHGIEVIELAKQEFGEKYVEKILEYLENSNLKTHNKALIYVSLENEMHNRVSENPNSVGDKKLQDLVRAKSQKLLREASLAINAGRLRALMRDGYITDPITNKMYSKSQLEGKKKVEKAIEADADQINDEAELLEQESESEPNFEIKTPRTKRTKTVVKKDISDTLKKMRADLLRAAKGDIAMVSLPYAAQIKVATPHIIKLSKLLAELGGMKTKEIIAEIHNNIKDAFDKVSKDDIEKILEAKNKPRTRKKTNPKVKKAKQLVKEALIDKGFNREITVTVNEKDVYGNILKDSNGNNKKVKERRKVLDWKKLAGEAGSIDNIRENVETVLKDKGYSDAELKSMSKLLEDEYTDIRASVIEKSLRELERRNKVKKKIDIKSSSKRLAELFNYGLFEKEADTYNNLINSALGFNDLDNKSFKELQELAKVLANLYNTNVSETGLQTSISYVNKEIARVLSNAAFTQGNTAYKLAAITQEYLNLSTRFLLHSLGQIIENPFSGYAQRVYSKIAYAFDKTDNKKLSDQRRKISKERFKSIVRDGGNAYGDTSSLLINDSKVENWLNGKTENELHHSLISFYMGRAFLEGFDSRHKTVLTEKYFAHNLIKVLSHPSNPNRMTKADALNFVTEQLTGESFEQAKEKAREVTKKINEDAGRKVLSEKERAINIFAQDIMKDNLLKGDVLTKEELESSFNAAYKSAGMDLGHVSNNIASEMVGGHNNKVENKLQQAIKEKDWNKAAYLTLYKIFSRNILNTFVGGGTNWVVLGLEKSGIYGLPMLGIRKLSKSNKKIDLTTTQGIKDLEKTLVEDMNYKNSAARVAIGSAIAVITASLAIGSGADDDINEWLKKNKWAQKYFNKLAPEVLIAILAFKNDDMGKYFKHVFNAKSEFFDLSNQAARSVTDLFSDKETKGSEAGKTIGGYTTFPAPLRTASDLKNIYQWATDKEVTKRSYKASGFWNGFFMGGLVEKVGLRPGEDPEKLEIQEIMDKRKSRPTRPSREQKQERRDNKEQKEKELRAKAKELGVEYVPLRR